MHDKDIFHEIFTRSQVPFLLPLLDNCSHLCLKLNMRIERVERCMHGVTFWASLNYGQNACWKFPTYKISPTNPFPKSMDQKFPEDWTKNFHEECQNIFSASVCIHPGWGLKDGKLPTTLLARRWHREVAETGHQETTKTGTLPLLVCLFETNQTELHANTFTGAFSRIHKNVKRVAFR